MIVMFHVCVGLFIVSFRAAVLSYLPLLVYVFYKASRFSKDHTVRSSVIFVIYSVCFVFFAGLFLGEWVRDHKKSSGPLPTALVRVRPDTSAVMKI